MSVGSADGVNDTNVKSGALSPVFIAIFLIFSVWQAQNIII